MAKLLAQVALPDEWSGTAPVPTSPPPKLGPSGLGQLVALPFGQIEAGALVEVLEGATAIRLTPWRTILLEGAWGTTHPTVLTDPADPLLKIDACPGAPRCAHASVDTHATARALARHITNRLHVSGCEKGCARAAPTALTLVGRNGRFDIVRDGTAQATPTLRGLTPDALINELT